VAFFSIFMKFLPAIRLNFRYVFEKIIRGIRSSSSIFHSMLDRARFFRIFL